MKIKAAGGIADLNDARDFVALGADRLGTSRIVKREGHGTGIKGGTIYAYSP